MPITPQHALIAAGIQTGYLGEVPPPLAPPVAPAGGGWTLVETPEALARAVGDLAGATLLAIDAEFVQVYHRQPDEPAHRLALLQLAGDPGVPVAYVVDALRLVDLAPLQRILDDPRVLKLFHGISADASVLAPRGLVARHTLDLEAVSRSIFGSRESSLQHMLQRACDIRLDKSLQRSDWTRRPLLPAMLGYAARDAIMTLALYHWLALRYPWATALHEVPGDPPALALAHWLAPLIDGSRGLRADWAVAQAGLEDDRAAQVADLRAALDAVALPPQRARVIRFIGALDLTELAPALRPLLAAPPAEVRTATARALGRLRDRESEAHLRALLSDPVEDVREAAVAALGNLTAPATPRAPSRLTRAAGAGATRWTLNGAPEASGASDSTPDEAPWKIALRARFAPPVAADPSPDPSITRESALSADDGEPASGAPRPTTPDADPDGA